MALTDEKVDREIEKPTTEPQPRTRRPIGRWAILPIVVLIGAGAIWYAMQVTPAEETGVSETEPLEFAQVVLTDLVELTEYDGTLGRLESDPVTVRISGTVTALPAEGSILEQGDALVWIDNQPVTLLYGDLPAWRTMSEDTEGPDVHQLEIALAELGFDEDGDMTVDEDFSSFTESLVEEWQAEIGAEDDGVVGFGEVVFLDGPVRVDSLQIAVGDQISQESPVFTTSSEDIEVTFDLPTTEEDSLAVGDTVEVTLPDLSTTAGTVTEIASVAIRPEGGGQSTFEVVVELNDPDVAAGIDEAPVTVEVLTDRVDDVMAVPIEALLALSEGGYAVEVEDGAGTRLVGVEPGFYADGLIEVSGDVSVGDRVVVP